MHHYLTCQVKNCQHAHAAAKSEFPLWSLPVFAHLLTAGTCDSHPGPSNDVGRSAPELDVFEALVNTASFYGEISQSKSFSFTAS